MWNMQFTFDIKTQPNVSIMDPYTSIAEMIIICNAKKKIRSKYGKGDGESVKKELTQTANLLTQTMHLL